MKRANHLFEALSDPETIRYAAWRAAKGKRYGKEVQEFFRDLDSQVVAIREQLLTVRLSLGPYRYFKVFEPKERQICASPFVDQVVHHSLMLVCHDTFEKAQIFDSYASRKGKGVYAALWRAHDFHRKYPWYLKLDVRQFFASLHHEVMKEQLRRLFKELRLLSLLGQIIDSYEASPERGVPIGNLTSQYFANHYLCGLDHWIKENLRCKGYVRYMDDMVLWSHDREQLKAWRRAIDAYVGEELRCELRPALLNRREAGLPFLGYRLMPQSIRLQRKSKIRFIRKVKRVEQHYERRVWTEAACYQRANSLYAFIAQGDTKSFRKSLDLGRRSDIIGLEPRESRR
jgi:hypothetical protein